jgi:tetratricopeptide (TPR) repeat protein
VLEELDTAQLLDADPWREHLRGRVLSALGRADDALESQMRALEMDDAIPDAHYSAGVLLADQGRQSEAMAHWRRAAELDPRHIDAHYNLAQAHYDRREPGEALVHWRAAHALAPDDFEILKKVVQAERALERWDDANRSMQALFELWQRSPDPDVRALHEVVVDQFEVAGHRVLASETLRPRDPELHYETTFRVFDGSNRVVMTAQLESSRYGRDRGIPFLMGVNTAEGHAAIGPTFAVKPSYRSVKEIARRVIGERLGTGQRGAPVD